MDDKEVGDLWARTKLSVVLELIRKLVDERAHVLGWLEREGYTPNDRVLPIKEYGNIDFERAALEDFGIDPESYREANNGTTDKEAAGRQESTESRQG